MCAASPLLSGASLPADGSCLPTRATTAGYAEYYVEIICAFVGLLVIRNVLLKVSRAYARRQRQKHADVVAADEKGATPPRYTQPKLARLIHAVDRAALTTVPGLPADWSYLRVLLIVIDIALCLVFSLVRPFST